MTGWPGVRIMGLDGISVFGSFAVQYSSEAALRGSIRNICNNQTPSRYGRKIVKSNVKHHSLYAKGGHVKLVHLALLTRSLRLARIQGYDEGVSNTRNI